MSPIRKPICIGAIDQLREVREVRGGRSDTFGLELPTLGMNLATSPGADDHRPSRRRNPDKVRSLVASLARHVDTNAGEPTLATDADLSRAHHPARRQHRSSIRHRPSAPSKCNERTRSQDAIAVDSPDCSGHRCRRP